MEFTTATMLLAVLLLIGANAFFVAAEFALVTARRRGLGEPDGNGEAWTGQLGRAQKNLGRSIAGTQLGIVLSTVGLGWIGQSAVARPLQSLFAASGLSVSTAATEITATVIAFIGLVLLHLIMGEMVPKSLAFAKPESVSRLVAGPLNVFNLLAAPFLGLIDVASRSVLREAGASESIVLGRVHGPEEIEMLLRESRAEGVVEEDEEEMIHGVFELTRRVAREVMTPRPDIVAFSEDASLEQVLDVVADSGLSRFPVYRESIDDVTGIVLVKDLLGWIRREDQSGFDLTKVMREPFFVPETKPVDDLLAEFRRQTIHLAVVIDEFGGTDGVVTLEDLVEEIVGDIFDEHDVLEEEIVLLDSGKARVQGGADPADVVERLQLGSVAEADAYDTVAGYVIGQLGRIPEPGDRVRFGPAELEVLETQEQRVTTLELRVTARHAAGIEEEPPADET